jgi:hypothetical protein
VRVAVAEFGTGSGTGSGWGWLGGSGLDGVWHGGHFDTRHS